MAIDEKTTQPFGMGPQDMPLSSKEVLETGEEMITMIFPHRVVLLTSDGKRVEFRAGIQEVPAHLADHDWLKRNGAQQYTSTLAKMTIANAKELEVAQAAFDKASADLAAAKAKAAIVNVVPSVVPAIVADDAAKTQEQEDADAEVAAAEAEEAAALAEEQAAADEEARKLAEAKRELADTMAKAAKQKQAEANAKAVLAKAKKGKR